MSCLYNLYIEKLLFSENMTEIYEQMTISW